MILIAVALLTLVTGGLLLKSQGKLIFSSQAGTDQPLTPSDKTAAQDFATVMKELGCSDQSSYICSKPENLLTNVKA